MSECMISLIQTICAFSMHVFYFNIPWIIDQSEYNCSSRTLAEWKERGSVNQYQAVYFSISGTIFLVSMSCNDVLGLYIF